MDTKEEDVEAFLINCKQKMAARIGGQSVIFYRNRDKNLQTQIELELKEFEREGYLNELEVRDYYRGPTKDRDDGPDLWEFGKMVKSREVYIKISVGYFNKPVICISFHFPESTINYPFR